MAQKRFAAEQIIIKLREAEVGLAQGQTVGQQAVVRISSAPQSLHHHFAGRILASSSNPLFHRARKFYFWMVSFLGKLTLSTLFPDSLPFPICRAVAGPSPRRINQTDLERAYPQWTSETRTDGDARAGRERHHEL